MAKQRLRSNNLNISYEPLHTLKANPQNPRVHSDKQVQQIARSIKAFGFNVPVLVDNEMNLIAGHGRVEAARLLKWQTVPTIRLEHLNASQRRAFMIADNKLSENSTWDVHLLGEQLKILSEAEIDFDIETIGFEMGEIDFYIEGLSPVPEGKPDPADELPNDPDVSKVSQPGDLWLLGKHRVLCGDALLPTSYTRLMSRRKAKAFFTDAPYNLRIDGPVSGKGKVKHKDFAMACGEMSEVEFTDFLRKVMTLAAANSVNGSIHFHCMDWRNMGEILTAGKEIYSELKSLCVWAKNNAGLGSLYRSQHELVFVFKHGKDPHRNNVMLGKYGRWRSTLWQYPCATSFSRTSSEGNLLHMHPTVKPVALVADAILDCTARGDLVLDPFLGSGTTVIAAEKIGRTCYGLEIDPKYVDTIVRRWQRFTGKSAVHEATGKSFVEMKETANVA